MLFHFDRSLWSILFATMQLLGLMSWSYSFEDEKGMKMFKFLLTTKEEEVLKKLAQKYPQRKTATAVDLYSKIIWCIDPRYPTFLAQYGQVKQIISTYPVEKRRLGYRSRFFKLLTSFVSEVSSNNSSAFSASSFVSPTCLHFILIKHLVSEYPNYNFLAIYIYCIYI